MTLKVCEQFYSLQGEGPTAGLPANFVRFRNCCLKCRWCDSKYAWKDSKSSVFSIEEVLENLDKRADIVVITGGEPLLYNKDLSFLYFLEALKMQRYEVEVETCALPSVPCRKMYRCVDRWNVSPKMPSSQYTKEHKELLKEYDKTIPFFLGTHVKKSIFKFVVSNEEDVIEVIQFKDKYNIPKTKIYLMPEGQGRLHQQNMMISISKLALEHGLAMTPRLHSLIWNGIRGV
jgi:7-carboxy-7-deazaguanine synthase